MCCNPSPKIRWLKKKKAIDPWNRLLDICWGTRTRTRKGRTRICSVTITPYPNHYVLYWNFIALKSFLCWGTRTRTRKGRTRICSVTITPYPNRVYFKDALLKYGCKSTIFCNICQTFRLFFIKIFFEHRTWRRVGRVMLWVDSLPSKYAFHIVKIPSSE